MKSKEDERQKLVLDLKKYKAVTYKVSIEGSREEKLALDPKNEKSARKNLKRRKEEKMELETTFAKFAERWGCCVVM